MKSVRKWHGFWFRIYFYFNPEVENKDSFNPFYSMAFEEMSVLT